MLDLVVIKDKLKYAICNSLDGEMQRFRTAQVLYIISVCAACLLGDFFRRLTFIIALLIISKEQRRAHVIQNWHGLTKACWFCLMALWLWATFIPVFFGDEPLADRLLGVPRPLEIALWVWGVLVFARDDYFCKKLYAIAPWGCIITATALFIQRAGQSFTPIYDGLLFLTRAEQCGMMLLMSLPWIIYKLIHEEKILKIILYWTAIIETGIVIISTYYSTVWVAFAIQTILSPFVIVISKMTTFVRACVKILMPTLFILIIIALATCVSPAIRSRIQVEYMQLSSICNNMQHFTNNRDEIWVEATNIIMRRPLTGYGWVDYNEYSAIKKHHPHSSYLQAAFHLGWPGMILFITTLFLCMLISLNNLLVEHKNTMVSFVVLIIVFPYSIAGLSEAYFFISRELALMLWVPIGCLFSNLDNDIDCNV